LQKALGEALTKPDQRLEHGELGAISGQLFGKSIFGATRCDSTQRPEGIASFNSYFDLFAKADF
jgi:hypothetical protein